MPTWSDIPPDRFIIDASLWSADLTALAADIHRLDPFVDSWHVDVADGHLVPDLLFFPDLVAAIRPLTTRPIHAHLMVDNPVAMAHAFVGAGADLITIHLENGEPAIQAVKATIAAGRAAGLAITLDTDPRALVPLLDDIDAVVLIGTPIGTKGTSLHPDAYRRITCTRALLAQHAPHRDIRVLADGGIRDHTVAGLAAAGTHGVVAGSLLFAATDPPDTAAWLHTFGRQR